MRKKLVIAIVAVVLVVGRVRGARTFFFYKDVQTPDGVYIQQIAPDKYELAFRYRETVYGSHESPTWPGTQHTNEGAYWFYLTTSSGTATAKDIVLTNYRACKDPGYHQKGDGGFDHVFVRRGDVRVGDTAIRHA